MALTHTPPVELGQTCPDFDLPSVTGKRVRRADVMTGKPFLVMFICNHCPYVKAIEDRLVELGRDLNKIGVATVAICSNDPVSYPDDSFENLKKRAEEKHYTFPYLHDLSQTTARAFGAVCTPDYFLYDGKGVLAYRGRLDDSWKEPAKVTRRELLEAATVLASGKPFTGEQIPSMGCSIKWVK